MEGRGKEGSSQTCPSLFGCDLVKRRARNDADGGLKRVGRKPEAGEVRALGAAALGRFEWVVHRQTVPLLVKDSVADHPRLAPEQTAAACADVPFAGAFYHATS